LSVVASGNSTSRSPQDFQTTFQQPRKTCEAQDTATLKATQMFSGESSQRNKLDPYTIIKFPLTTELAMEKIEDNSTLVFIVDCPSGGKATSWWRLCSGVQHGGGNILVNAKRWRLDSLLQCVTWRPLCRVRFLAAFASGQYGGPYPAEVSAICHVDVSAGVRRGPQGVFAPHTLGGLCSWWHCRIVKDGGLCRVCGESKREKVGAQLFHSGPRGSAPCWPSMTMAISRGKDQNGSQMIVDHRSLETVRLAGQEQQGFIDLSSQLAVRQPSTWQAGGPRDQ
ncbi:60S ribosomal protein L23a, partial [Galemys pyrenaicus]